MKREAHAQPDGPILPRFRARRIVGLLSLGYGLYLLLRFPLALHTSLSQPPLTLDGPLSWLVTFGLPWHVGHVLHRFIGAGWAVGLTVAGFGLLLTKPRALRAGLVVLAPLLLARISLVPGEIAVMAGHVFVAHPTGMEQLTRLPDEMLPWAVAILLGFTLLEVAYFLWSWRELRRMSQTTDSLEAISVSSAPS